jgi:hypothetical protein
MAAKKEERTKYIVIARSTDTIKEMYAIAGNKRIPFDEPVYLNKRDIESLKRQREPIQVEKQVSVRDIMNKHQVSQVKAQEMAKLISENPDQGGKQITFVSKYVISPA